MGVAPPGKGMISLTFDDGFESQLNNAVPILKQANLPASFYIITRANEGGAAWNEVQNPSLETSVATGTPYEWSQYLTGTNTTAFSYANTGIDGTHSARIDVTSYTSGDAAWYFQPVAVLPGTNYTISHQYNSNASTSVLVRFTLHNGSVSYVDMGGLASSSGQWKSQTFTVTAPANGRNDSPARISKVRSLVVDNFSVKETNPYSNPDYMTPAQIQSLQAAGFEVGAHTMTHRSDIFVARRCSRRNRGCEGGSTGTGHQCQDTRLPLRGLQHGHRADCEDEGFISARTVNSGTNTSSTDKFALLHHEVDRTTTVADVQGWINTATQTGSYLILTFHAIDNTSDFYGTTPQTFQQIVNLVSTSNLTPVTMADDYASFLGGC